MDENIVVWELSKIISSELEKLTQRFNIVESKVNDLQEDIEVVRTILQEQKVLFQNDTDKSVSYADSGFTEEPITTEIPVANIKNPVSVLNDLYLGAQFQVVERMGSDHNPCYVVAVTVEGKTFKGAGGTKKSAKAKAAEVALQFLRQEDANCVRNEKMIKGASMTLNELCHEVEYRVVESTGLVASRFQVTAIVKGEQFVGIGPTKKQAKAAAALAALQKLEFNAGTVDLDFDKFEQGEEQRRAEVIATMVKKSFNNLMCTDFVHRRYKVLSGFVMVRNGDFSEAEVVSIATGSKFISGEYISMTGTALNDMHADILSRRGLLNFLYDQLELIAKEQTEKSIFEEREDGCGYRLKKGIEFHLYISTAPCGDARLFTRNEQTDYDKHPARISRGLLRTKVEAGQGFLPVPKRAIQTWDAILQGNRLLTMTCSDKICKWNFVGVQGALLAHFIEPIYLKSIIFGSLFKESHIKRALYERIESTVRKPPSYLYRLNKPSIFGLSTHEGRSKCLSNSNTFCVLWGKGYTEPEIIDANKGKPNLGVSKTCKRELAKRFLNLVGKLSGFSHLDEERFVNYEDIKKASFAYNGAKKTLFKAFEDANLGTWVSKPLEQDMFSLKREEEC